MAFEECRQGANESFGEFYFRLWRLADSAELCQTCYGTNIATRIMVGIRDSSTKTEAIGPVSLPILPGGQDDMPLRRSGLCK